MTGFFIEDAFARVGAFGDASRHANMLLATQRSIVLEELSARTDHPTAETIFAAVRDRLPEPSLETVQRVLDDLVRTGDAIKPCHVGAAARFDARTDRHHHLVCTDCQRVFDVEALSLSGLRFPAARRAGFEIRDYSVVLRGKCADCLVDELMSTLSEQRKEQLL